MALNVLQTYLAGLHLTLKLYPAEDSWRLAEFGLLSLVESLGYVWSYPWLKLIIFDTLKRSLANLNCYNVRRETQRTYFETMF